MHATASRGSARSSCGRDSRAATTSRTPSTVAAARSSASRCSPTPSAPGCSAPRAMAAVPAARRAWRSGGTPPRLPPRTSPASRPSPAIRRRGGRGRTSVCCRSHDDDRLLPGDHRLQILARHDESGAAAAVATAQQRDQVGLERACLASSATNALWTGRRTSGTPRPSAPATGSGTRSAGTVCSIDAASANRPADVASVPHRSGDCTPGGGGT